MDFDRTEPNAGAGPATDSLQALWIATHDEPPPAIRGVRYCCVRGGREGLGYLRAAAFDAVVAHVPLPDWNTGDFLSEARRVQPATPVLVSSPAAAVTEVVEWMKAGAAHCFAGPLDSTELARQLEVIAQARSTFGLAALRQAVDDDPWRRYLVGRSLAIDRVCQIIRLVGPRRSTVLVSGETGTGKEMVARALHEASDRAAHPWVAVNCSALPEPLLEAELFGHVKGAFTGAMQQRTGRFEQAHRGTIFFDEIGDMPLDLQAKLLRVLQEREFQRLGSSETVRVDVRVVVATNVDLGERVRKGRFREDLYYRLNVIPVRTPPLRDRRADIPLLTDHFLEKICRFEQIPLKQVSPEALEQLADYSWPGNVRQLENAVEMAVALSGDRRTLLAADFPLPETRAVAESGGSTDPLIAVPDDGLDFEETVSRFERNILTQALLRTAGNKKQAAELLRLKRTTLSAKLRALGATA